MRFLLASAALSLIIAAPAAAQRQPSPEQRIDRLERQLRQLQGRVFPQGQPASTAGLPDDPAASQTVVIAQSNRIDNLERQLAEMTRLAEENGNRVTTLQSELDRVRNEQERRLSALERAVSDPPNGRAPAQARTQPQQSQPTAAVLPSTGNFEADGEAAYDLGFQLWTQRKYDESVAALRAMSSAFKGHRRVSWANNLAGRALLDKGEPRAAAEALLANYRGNPKGERAADSLFYLGQSLVALKQQAQACKAYAELEEVYGSNIRAELKSLLPGAKSRAGCR